MDEEFEGELYQLEEEKVLGVPSEEPEPVEFGFKAGYDPIPDYEEFVKRILGGIEVTEEKLQGFAELDEPLRRKSQAFLLVGLSTALWNVLGDYMKEVDSHLDKPQVEAPFATAMNREQRRKGK